MEETIKKQQEMINALKEKIESKETVAYASVSKIEENKIEQVIDDYLTKDNTREKMVKAG
jgi:pyrroline-5-carboxylate reductase